MSFDFDTPLDRAGTYPVKYELRRAKFGRDDVLPLWVADMDLTAPDCVREALAARAAHPIYGYTVTPRDALEAIVEWQWRQHGWRVEPDWILVGPGLLPLLAVAIEALSRPGEAVAVPTPVYNPLFEGPERLGRRVQRLPLLWDGQGHRFDFDALAAALGPDTKLLLLCSPHNPGGRVWRREELERLGEICLRRDLLVVSDEIHADLVYPDHKHLPLASLSPELAARTVTLNSPGKTFNIAGLNCAYAIVPDPVLRARLHATMQAQWFEGANLMGLAALTAAYRAGGPWLAALLDYLAGNRDLALGILAERAPRIVCPRPEATYLLWLDCRALGLADADLRQRLIDAGLGLSPGIQFGPEGSGFMRLNFALPRAQLAPAMARLAAALG
ncbi:MAG: PatB family C-S lyase [Thiobacillaceae bacterium]|nr:PatB family C-S lyase [Thiobacillaceae bacterium]